jgi:hypothetical protein
MTKITVTLHPDEWVIILNALYKKNISKTKSFRVERIIANIKASIFNFDRRFYSDEDFARTENYFLARAKKGR